MVKTISAGLTSVVVVFVAGTSQAQLFIEDFDTFTGWSGGDGTQITSKTGDTTNGWVKGALHNLRRPAAAISAIGMNGTQGVRRPEKGAELGGAVRDITGEINPNGNYMVRMQNQIDPGSSGPNPRGVHLKIGDETAFERFTNINEQWIDVKMIAPGWNRFDQITIKQGTTARGPDGSNDVFSEYYCELEDPNAPPGKLEPLPLDPGAAPCLRRSGDPYWDGQYFVHMDYASYGTWMEVLMNVNMNNDTTTAWYRDVDDTTGAPTGPWKKQPWNFSHGRGSTTFGLPFTAPVAAGFFVWGSSGGIVDNFISGHPLLANQGDFDGDGDIDGNDFLIWQNNFPRNDGEAISFIGDATGDGNVDGDDFLIWQNSFPYPAALSKTPEPASLGLLALGGLLMLRRRAVR